MPFQNILEREQQTHGFRRQKIGMGQLFTV